MRCFGYAAVTLTSTTSVAVADIVEMTASGTFVDESSLLPASLRGPATGGDLEGESWEMTVLYDTSRLFDSAFISATVRVGDMLFNIDGPGQATDPTLRNSVEFRNHNEQVFSAPDDGLARDGIGFNLKLGDGLEFRLSALAPGDWWEFLYDGSGSWNSMNNAEGVPVEYDLSEFVQVGGWFGSPAYLETELGNTFLARGEWGLVVDSFNARVVPAPFGAAVLGGGLLATARRRR